MNLPREAEIAAKLDTIFTALMPDENMPVRRRTKVNCTSWDSLFHLTLILAIEQEFNVTLSDEDAIDLNSFESVLQVLQEKLLFRDGRHGQAL